MKRLIDRLRVYVMGMREYRESITTNPGEELIEFYDRGRDRAHALTMQRYDT